MPWSESRVWESWLPRSVTPDAELRVNSDLTGDALPLLLAFFGGSPEAGEVQMQAGALPFDGAAGFRLCLPEESVWFAPLAEPHAERLPPTLCGLSPPRQHVRLEHPRLAASPCRCPRTGRGPFAKSVSEAF